MEFTPRDDVLQTTLLFLRRDNQLLLATKKRGYGVEKWNGVGGKIEPGESVEQGAIRECFEEIGVRALNLTQVGLLRFHQTPALDKYSHSDCHVFTCDQWQGEPTESEEMAPRWFDERDIPYENMWPDDPHWLPELLDGNQFVGDFYFDESYEIIDHHIETA